VRIVIVGGGVIGLLTAVDCVWAGHHVVVVDQANIPFAGSASYDRHRVVRGLHLGDPAATAAAVRAHHQWIGLEYRLATTFYQRTGALTALPDDTLAAARELLSRNGSRTRAVGPAELASSYPHLRFSDGMSALHESHAGVLLADRVLAACAGWLRRHPRAEVRPHRRVVGIDADERTVWFAGGETLSGDALLVAAGPWSRALLGPDVADGLTLYRQSMLYCAVPEPDLLAWSAIPTIPSLGRGGTWLVPPVAGTPLKLSASSACRVEAEVGDFTTPAYWRERLLAELAPSIPGLDPSWLVDSRDCYYLADTATGGPVLTVLGEGALAYAACGGSSFKFAPLIARSLAERLTGARPTPTGLEPLDRAAAPVPAGALAGAGSWNRSVMRGVS